jgi:hypothetical protein
MIFKVTTNGVLIPKYLFHGADEVELLREGDRYVIVPIVRDGEGEPSVPAKAKIGSIFDLGSNPITLGVTDASVRLDDYIYGDPHGDES